jgi:hypothetical protein
MASFDLLKDIRCHHVRWYSRRRGPLVGLPADELDVEMNPLVGEVRPSRLPVFDDEQQAVVCEQRDVVVDPAEVAVQNGSILEKHVDVADR